MIRCRGDDSHRCHRTPGPARALQWHASFEDSTAVAFEPNMEETVLGVRVIDKLLEAALSNLQLLLFLGHLTAIRNGGELGQPEHSRAQAQLGRLFCGNSDCCHMVEGVCPHGEGPKRSSPPVAFSCRSKLRKHTITPMARRVRAVPHQGLFSSAIQVGAIEASPVLTSLLRSGRSPSEVAMRGMNCKKETGRPQQGTARV